MKSKQIVIIAALMLLTLTLSAQNFLSKNAVGLHAGTQSGSGYSMRFMGEKHGFQATIGAVTWGNDDVYFPDRYYYWYGDFDAVENLEVPGDTLVTLRQDGRVNIANLGLNYIYTLDKFNVLEQKDHGRLYVMAGGSYQYNRQNVLSKDYNWIPPADSTQGGFYGPVNNDDPVKNSTLQHRWTAGAGLGVELGFGKNFRVAVELPVTYNWESRIVMYIPQIGIYYYFK